MKSDSSSLYFRFLNFIPCRANNPRVRVADIIFSDDEEEGIDGEDIITMRDGCRIFECTSPRVIVSRWVAAVRWKGKERKGDGAAEREKKQKEGKRRDKEGRELGCGSEQMRCLMNGLNEELTGRVVVEECRGDCQMGDQSGLYGKEISFNLGVGFGLIYLMAVSKNELDKMLELRKQMELLLQNVTEELHKNSRVSKPSNSSSNVAYSTTDVEGSVYNNSSFGLQDYTPSQGVTDFGSTAKSNQTLHYDMPKDEEYVEGIDRLEAELEAELGRLQLHLDTDYLPIHPEEERTEVVGEETVPGESLSPGFREVLDPYETDAGGHSGVPPNELKIRLYELLEEKQEERIKELESALERAKQKLHEKEIEVSWWKETARLISQRVLKSRRLVVAQNDTGTSKLSR